MVVSVSIRVDNLLSLWAPVSIQLGYCTFFAVAATISFFYYSLSWLLASEGTHGAKLNTLSSFIALIVLVGFDLVLIPLICILGAAITLIFAYLIPAFYLLSKRRVLSANLA